MKALKIIIAILVIILVIILCYKSYINKPGNEVVENEVTNTEEVEEINNKVENEVVEEDLNTVENNVTNTESATTKENAYESNSDVGTTSNKEEAIKLVKEKWGEDSQATFRCDSVSADGTYIIAVVKGGKVQNYFKVNLETKSVEIDY